ncbi:MAG: cyclopropane-fatty-acyl-phospholipid synthase family protein [Sandaracinaceae bacterium]
MKHPSAEDHLNAQRIAFAPLLFQAARTARDCGLLTAIEEAGEEGRTALELTAAMPLSEYATRLVLDACESLGLVLLDDEDRTRGRYRIAGAGTVFLHDERTRVSLNFTHDVCYRGAFHMDEALREGRPAGLPTLGDWDTIYEGVPELPAEIRDSWYAFDHHYSDGVFPRAVRFLQRQGVERVLDVGCNTGRFAVLAAAKMDVTLLDHPGEMAIALANAKEAGVDARVTPNPIELLDHDVPFPTGFDAVWMSQVLDCFSKDDIVRLLSRGAAALAEGGRIYIVESYPDRQPAEAGKLALHALSLYFACLANGTSRMYYASDLLECAERAGLIVEDDRTLGPWHTLMVLRTK